MNSGRYLRERPSSARRQIPKPRSTVCEKARSMPRPIWLLIPAILVAVMACGHSGPAGGTGTEITYHLADSGRQVTVNVGDRLSLDLGSSSDRHWVLEGFPPGAAFCSGRASSGRLHVYCPDSRARAGRCDQHVRMPAGDRPWLLQTRTGKCPQRLTSGLTRPSVFTLTVHVVV